MVGIPQKLYVCIHPNKKFLKKINDMPDDSKKDNYKKQYKKERDIEKIKYLQTGDLNILIDFINNYENIHPFPDYDKWTIL